MEAAGEGLVETASDTSSAEMGLDTTPSSPTSSQEFLDGIESGSEEDEEDVVSDVDVVFAAARRQQLLAETITCEAINVVGWKQEQLEMIKAYRALTKTRPATEEELLEYKKIGLLSLEPGNWIVSALFGNTNVGSLESSTEHQFYISPVEALTDLGVLICKVLDHGSCQAIMVDAAFYIQHVDGATPMFSFHLQADNQYTIDVGRNLVDVSPPCKNFSFGDLSAIAKRVCTLKGMLQLERHNPSPELVRNLYNVLRDAPLPTLKEKKKLSLAEGAAMAARQAQ